MRYITIILLALMCAACSSALPSLKPYRMDIQQGNVVTSKMMLQLRPGMTKSQVRFIMGTPLIQDSFHTNRWDYFYEMRKGGRILERRRVILEFENDALKRVRGDVIPAGTGEPEAGPSEATAKPRPKKKTEEKGLLDRLKFWKDDDDARDRSQEAPSELVSPAATPAQEKPAPKQAPAQEQAQPSQPEPSPAKPVIEPTQEPPAGPAVKGMPEPAGPLGPDPKDVERQVAPQVETPRAREIDAAPQPTVEPPARSEQPPAPAAPTAAEPTPQASPEKSPPVVRPQPAQTQTQQPAAQQAEPETRAKPSADDLPPEEDPGYFERMLEKIGF